MQEMKSWLNRIRGEKTVEMLKKHNFDAQYFDTAEEAKTYALSLIEANNPVGFGGSMTTTKQLGLNRAAKDMGKTICDHSQPGLSPEGKVSARRAALTSQLYITSTNGVTVDGKLVNIDGTGNRVAAMAFGPEKTLIIAGANKISDTVDDAIRRIKQIACPQNARRLGLSTPCAKTGFCSDCDSPQRFCNVTEIIERKPTLSSVEVIVVGEDLGY